MKMRQIMNLLLEIHENDAHLPPRKQGFKAYYRWESYDQEDASSANPYPEGSKEAAEWDEGWDAAENEYKS